MLQIPFEIVSPTVWQRELFKGNYGSKDSKDLSIAYCLQKYPTAMWKATERCRKYHDGKTDATCIALYGKRKNSCAFFRLSKMMKGRSGIAIFILTEPLEVIQ